MLPPGRWLLSWLPPLLALGIALLPTLLFGFPRGHDWLLELTRIAEYGNAVADGQWPPHWAPNVYGGLGAPVFLFYAPLFLIVASASATLAGSVTTGAVVALWIFAGTGALAMADLARSVCSTAASGVRVAVLLFVLHPYLLADALLRNANAEFAALCLLPLPLTGVVRLAAGSGGGAARLTWGLALVVMAHNLTALVAAAAVVVLGAVLLYDAGRRAQLRWLAACIAGLLLSAWLWIPALAYRRLIRQDELTAGKLDFHGNFSPIVGWSRPTASGYLTALVLAACFLWLILRRPTGLGGRVAFASTAGAAACLVLQMPWSVPAWEAAPFLPLFQFPWRFQGPLAVCSATLAAIAWAQSTRAWRPALRSLAEVVMLVCLVLNAVPHLSNVRPLTDEARQDLTTWMTPEGIRTHGLKVTVSNEYLPAQGIDPSSLPYGPTRVPPLRRVGLALSFVTLLGWLGLLARRKNLASRVSLTP